MRQGTLLKNRKDFTSSDSGNLKGFTFLELLIGVSITIILGVLVMISFVQSRNVRDLVSNGQNSLSILRVAQSKTLAGDGNSSWGVHLESGRFILFQGTSYSGSAYTEIYSLPLALEIANITLAGGGVDVIFNRLAGTTDQAGSFVIRIKNSNSNVFAVTVDASGKVYQTGTAPVPAGTRITDSRHRNFNLAGTIQNSTALQFVFSDPPSSDIPVSITMIPPAPRTSFDWSGTISVNGQNQILRIHALYITSNSTLLSVDRDCRTNNKKVKISFDGITMATYEADCKTITVSPLGGTMSEP